MTTAFDEAAEPSPDQGTVAAARLRFLTGEEAETEAVRRPVLASWHRSRAMDVPADHVQPTYEVDPPPDSALARGAGPVITRLGEQLDGQAVSVVLTDPRGLVLDRLTAEKDLERHLDRVCLAPGFNYAEGDVGTNGIGTALEMGGPAHVFGHEHYAEHLEELACAAVPIRHPTTGRLAGAVDLTCWRRDAGALLLTLAKSTADQIRSALWAATGAFDLALLQEYQRTCNRTAGSVIALGGATALLNEHARHLLDPADQAALLEQAEESLGARNTRVVDLVLPSGHVARLHLRQVADGNRPGGLVADVHLDPRSPQRRGAGHESAAHVPLPGLVGTSPAWRHAGAEVEAAFQRGEWLAVQGEPGVGKLALLRAVQLRRVPVGRLVVVDAAEATDPAWAASLRARVREAPDALVVTHVDRLDHAGVRSVVDALEELRRTPRNRAAWAAVTLSAGADTRTASPLLRLFPGTVEVPPLRLRRDDVEPLVSFLLARLGTGGRLRCSSEAMRLLVRLPWPGNVTQVQQLLRRVVAHRRSGVVGVADLPPEAHSTSRRVLSSLEALERDAIVRSLVDAGGNKTRAAEALGMSRATIYRKIHDYGIVPVGPGS